MRDGSHTMMFSPEVLKWYLVAHPVCVSRDQPCDRSEKEQQVLNAAEKAINHCSELMLRPGAGVIRSSRQADDGRVA